MRRTLNSIYAVYGDTLGDLVISTDEEGEWNWEDDPSTPVGELGEHIFKAIYTPEDSKNYNSETVEIVVTVGKAVPEITEPDGLTAKVGQTLAEEQLPAGWAWQDAAQALTQAGETEVTAVYTPEDVQHYETREVLLTVLVEEENRGCGSSAGAVGFLAGAAVLCAAGTVILRKKRD